MKGKRARRKLTKRQIGAKYKIVGSIDIDAKVTRKDLEKYIRTATQLINASASTMNKASKADYQKAMRVIGTGRIKGTLGTGITRTIRGKRITKKKAELEAQAKLLRSILNGDKSSYVSKEFSDIKQERAYQSFRKSTFGGDFTREEYADLIWFFNQASDWIKEYGSDQAKDIIAEFKDEFDPRFNEPGKTSVKTLGEIILTVYHNFKGGEQSDLTKAIVDEIKRTLKDEEIRKHMYNM